MPQDGNDAPIKPAAAEQPKLESADVHLARNASGQTIAANEELRTNASDGSLRNRLKLAAEQEDSIKIVGIGGRTASRLVRLTEKDLSTSENASDDPFGAERAHVSEQLKENQTFKLRAEVNENEWQSFSRLPAGQQRKVIEAFQIGAQVGQDSYAKQSDAISESVPKGFYNAAKSIYDCAANASKFVYDLAADPVQAQLDAKAFSDHIGTAIGSGLHLSSFLADYSADVVKHGEWNKPISDLNKVAQIVDDRWNSTPLEQRTEKASEMIASMGIAAPAGFISKLANSTKLIAALDELDAALSGAVSAAKGKSAQAFGKIIDELLQPVGDTGTGLKIPVPRDAAKDSAEYIAKMEGRAGSELPSIGHRGDHDIFDKFNTKGRPKSHINEDGDLVPANPIGYYKGEKVTLTEHINARQCRGAKANSPYTSFSYGAEVIAKYGGSGVKLNLEGLQAAIAQGKLPGVKIFSHEDILEDIANSRFRDTTKQTLTFFAKRDKEFLVEGIIPRQYLTVLQK